MKRGYILIALLMFLIWAVIPITPLVYGDADYWSHGPAVQSKVKLITMPDTIDAAVSMVPQETENNKTRLEVTHLLRL